MYSRRLLVVVSGLLSIAGQTGAQDKGRTTLHDFDSVGDVSSARTDWATIETVESGRNGGGQALRISFRAVPDAPSGYPAVVFEKSSLTHQDFSRAGAIGLRVKNEGDNGAYLRFSVTDSDGKAPQNPPRTYLRAGVWQQVVYPLDLQDVDRRSIVSLHLARASRGAALSILVDDIELLTPVFARIVRLEDEIRLNIEQIAAVAPQLGLEGLVAEEVEELTRGLKGAAALPEAERHARASRLARQATSLARTIQLRRLVSGGPVLELRLNGPRVTDEWLAACAPKIEDFVRVSLQDTAVTDAGLAHLRTLKDLDHLDLFSPRITGTGLEVLAEAKLRTLRFNGGGVTDAGLESVATFRELERLSIDDTGVTDVGLHGLGGLSKLKTLSLKNTGITDEGLSRLGPLPALTYLNVEGTSVTDLAPLGELSSLYSLMISDSHIDDEGLRGLGPLPDLTVLSAAKTKVMGPALAGLKDARKLSWVVLSDTPMNDAAVAALADLPALTRLEISSTRITDATLARFAEAGRLTYLDIYGTNVTADGIRRLAALKTLTELYAGDTAADDASIAALNGLGKLFHLDLQGTRITDASLETIGTFRDLNSLNLSRTGLTGASLTKLSGIHELRTLNLAGTAVSDEALATITGVLIRPVNPDNGAGGGFAWLNRLFLANTQVSDTGLDQIARLRHLFVLGLGGTNITDAGLRRIARLPELEHLWLDGTAVSDDGIAALSNFDRLVSLRLNRTSITDKSLERLGGRILRLSLSHTPVSDAGVRTLADKQQLELLELAGTAVTDHAVEAIAGLPDLRTLDLSGTDITDQAVVTLKSAAALEALRLDRTTLTDYAAESLARIETLSEVSLGGTRVTADGKALLSREHPDLAVALDHPMSDTVWADEDVSGQSAWSSSTLSEEVAVTDLQRRSAVRSMSFRHRPVDPTTLRALRNLDSLESLDLADTTVDDALLAELSGLQSLRALRLSRTAISDDGLRHVADLPRLEQLVLDGTELVGSGLKQLRGLTSLRSIHLRETKLDDEHAAHLSQIKSLRRISLTNTRIGDAGLAGLQHLPALRYLDLFGTDVTDAGLEAIGGMSTLSHLYLSETAVTDAGLAALRGFDQLVELGIDRCAISDRGLAHLTGFSHLERLRLSGTRVSDVGIETISAIGSLRTLELSNTAITDSSVSQLRKLTELRHLELNGTALTDSGLEQLASLVSLERLTIRDTEVSRAGIESFAARRPDVTLEFESHAGQFSWAGIGLAIVYGLIALIVCVYGAHRYLLVWLFSRSDDMRTSPVPASTFSELPRVTIQIPLFNERNVAERIIAAACAMDYPRELLQIQVLDDSTDDCTRIVRACCERFRNEGIDIVCHHRESRDGFKSGALAAGLETSTGELIAIFDADFVPAPDFLQRTVHHFTDPKVGVVQAEWRHLNRNESLLTQCQAMFLNGHFIVEQATRARTGRWFNFNGTAGLWRRVCIDQSGGWRHDTLTEDTDLSYRAQLDGWRFVYLPDVQVDAELPSTISAFLSQQHRWTRGLLQCAVRLMPRIVFSKAPLRVKAEAWFHLTAPILYAVLFVLAVLAVPATFLAVPLSQLRGLSAWSLGTAVLLGGTIAAAVYYVIAERAAGQSLWRTLLRLPVMMSLGIGMSAVNTRAAAGALLGVRSPFVRTPKFGGRTDSEADPAARAGRGRLVGLFELAISGVLFACLLLSLRSDFVLIGAPFLLLFGTGFLWVGGARLVESGPRVTISRALRFRALRWSATTLAVAAAAGGLFLATRSIQNSSEEMPLLGRVAGVDLTDADWRVRGSSIATTESRRDGLVLDVDLDPDAGQREEGEIFIDLTGALASLGDELSDSQEVVFAIAYPQGFSGELQAFVSDEEGKSQYGPIAFVERHDALRHVRVAISPGPLTPPMGYTDPEFDADRSMRRIGLKVSAQSDRVRGRGYRPFQGELTVSDVRLVPRINSEPPEIRTVPQDDIHRPEVSSREAFLAASGLDRPWPLGYAFSGPVSAEQQKTLEETYAALEQQGLGFTRVYVGDYRTGLVFDAEGHVTGVEPQFLDYLDALAETANRHGVTVMFSLMDNTLLDGKGVEFPQFVVDRQESERFIANVLRPIVENLEGRKVVWDLFNEPENVTGAELSTVQGFVGRALSALRKSAPSAKFTVVSRSAPELVYWRGRGLDVLSHNVFNKRSLDSAVSLHANTDLDAPVWIAEMDPALATEETLESLRQAGYRGVGLWGWGTDDKYDWSVLDVARIACPLVPSNGKCVKTGNSDSSGI